MNYPDLSGNIPRKPAYGIYSSQIIHYARSCSREPDLISRIQDLTRKLAKKKFVIQDMKVTLRKCLLRHPWIAVKLGRNSIKKIFGEQFY